MFEWLKDHAWETWLGLGIVLGVIEMISLDMIFVMLATGAGVGMLAALVGLPIGVQVLLAVAASVAALTLVRPSLVKRLQKGPDLEIGHSRLVGQEGVVLREVTATSPGLIKISGEEWTARPYDSTLTIAAGTHVEVFSISGATALVHPVGELPL